MGASLSLKLSVNPTLPAADQVEALALAARRGDLSSFNQLVLLHQRQVYNLCLRMLANPGSAEDVSQEAFISAYRRIDTYRGGSFKAWLLRIATNACYDLLRRQGRRPASSLDKIYEESDSPPIPDTREVSPQESVERKELQRSVQRALQLIPADQRAAIILCDLQGLAYEEIAATLDVNIGTVKSRINRGRARLRELLTAGGELKLDAMRPTGRQP